MASVNKVILVGNLGADPEIKVTSGGTAVAEFRMATTFGVGDKAKTEWHRVKVWDKLVKPVEFLHKGSSVYVEGRIETRSWVKDGETKYMTEVVADRIQLLDKRDTSKDVSTPDSDFAF